MATWQFLKPLIFSLVIGLVVGPLASVSLGWMVWRGTAKAQVRASFVEQGAAYCAAQVRSHVKNPSALNFEDRNAHAMKWTSASGEGAPDVDIARACAFKLAD